MFDAELHKPGLYTSGLFTDGLLGSSAFDGLKRLTHPMVVATKGNNPLETGRYPQPTTVLNLDATQSQHVITSLKVTGGSPVNVQCYIKTTQTSGLRTVFSCGGYSSSVKGLLLGQGANGELQLWSTNGSAASVQYFTGARLSITGWNYLELEWDGGDTLAYLNLNGVDYVSDSTMLGWSGDSSDNLQIGSYNNGASGFFTARLSSFKFESEINLPLNQTSGTVALDRAGDNHGTLMNGASWVVDNTLPWQADVTNEEGYTLGTGSNGAAVGVIIPPSTIDQTKDCIGNDLQFSGSVYPVIPAANGPNKNCYQVTELGDYTAATVNLGAADDIADSDTKASVLTLTNNRVFKNDTTNEIVAFQDTLTGDDFDKADSYTE